MAICDLSTRNPNVLFELGFRQAFDKPTVLVQEENTERIFDISGFRTIDYRSSLKYHEVLGQENVKLAIEATRDAIQGEGNVYSLVHLLSVAAAEVQPGAQVDGKWTANKSWS